MNIRAVCDNHSKLSVKLPQFARHEKLAFIERVCALLIESRFDNGHAEAWEDWCSSSEDDLDEAFWDKPRFAPPAVGYSQPRSAAGWPALMISARSAAGLPAFAGNVTRASPRLNQLNSWDAFVHFGISATAIHPVRGSPQ